MGLMQVTAKNKIKYKQRKHIASYSNSCATYETNILQVKTAQSQKKVKKISCLNQLQRTSEEEDQTPIN